MNTDTVSEAPHEAKGLSDSMIDKLRARYGYNELPAEPEHLVRQFFKNFWGPLPWLMEFLIVLSFFSGQKIEGSVIAVLLIINTVVSLLQRRSAKAALATLTKKLSVSARVWRDGVWGVIPAKELLPGDVIRVRIGDIIPADALIIEGNISVDLSSLTGESLPKDQSAGEMIFSGSIAKRGEATAHVTAIGAATAYGKTTELLETSHPPTHMEKIIFGIIKYTFIFNAILAVTIVIFGVAVHAAEVEIINFVIVLLLTSVPISFPTMFAVAQSYGALELSEGADKSVLVRRLAAVQECAMVDVFCSDKTGTLTKNELAIVDTIFYGSYSKADALTLAAAASDESNKDSIDMAIFEKISEEHLVIPIHSNFKPFDPLTKRTEADAALQGTMLHVLKGLPELLLEPDVLNASKAREDVLRLSKQGLRVVAIVIEKPEKTSRECVGLIALADPIRSDAPEIIKELNDLGVRIVMITGDGRATAAAVAEQLGLSGAVVTPEDLKRNPEDAVESSVFAEAYPEDKLTIIRALQKAGHTVGMTGDGVNDAPALRQAEAGIAVSGATDVAKQSASFILTSPGLEGVVRAVKISRSVYARIRTWAINKVIKSFEVSFFTTIIFFITHSYILSPLLAVLLIFANDFVTIATATDKAEHVHRPARWDIGSFTLGSIILSAAPLLALAIVYIASHGYSTDVVRTIVYVALIYFGKANLYAVRSWSRRRMTIPSKTLVIATLFSIGFTTVIAGFGVLIAPLPFYFFFLIIALGCIDFILLSFIKRIGFVRRLVGITAS